jgi:hypothetical protein
MILSSVGRSVGDDSFIGECFTSSKFSKFVYLHSNVFLAPFFLFSYIHIKYISIPIFYIISSFDYRLLIILFRQFATLGINISDSVPSFCKVSLLPVV